MGDLKSNRCEKCGCSMVTCDCDWFEPDKNIKQINTNQVINQPKINKADLIEVLRKNSEEYAKLPTWMKTAISTECVFKVKEINMRDNRDQEIEKLKSENNSLKQAINIVREYEQKEIFLERIRKNIRDNKFDDAIRDVLDLRNRLYENNNKLYENNNK